MAPKDFPAFLIPLITHLLQVRRRGDSGAHGEPERRRERITRHLAIREDLSPRMPFRATLREAHFTTTIAGALRFVRLHGRVDCFRMARDPRGIWLPTLDAFGTLAA